MSQYILSATANPDNYWRDMYDRREAQLKACEARLSEKRDTEVQGPFGGAAYAWPTGAATPPPGVQEICRTQSEIGRDIKAALERSPDKPMPTTTHRIELVKQLRAEAKAAQLNLDGIPGVIAGGILHLADLCDKAADEIERRDEDRAYGEKQFALSATGPHLTASATLDHSEVILTFRNDEEARAFYASVNGSSDGTADK